MDDMALKKRVFYGEYTLQHWIDLILKKNIVLPEYQRHFVWDEFDAKRFIDNLNDGIFIPPVTLGQICINGNKSNIILDGQQRLTTLLLAYINKFPVNIGENAESSIEKANENDDIIDPNETKTVLRWTFNELLKFGSDRDTLITKCVSPLYKDFDFNASHSFFLKKCLGFSYIVPDTSDQQEQISFYSSTFRNINVSGKKLLKEESRRSLYFLNSNYTKLFEPGLDDYTVGTGKEARAMDFVRYMSLLSDYTKSKNQLSTYLTTSTETYYEQYISSVLEDSEEGTFRKFSDIFPEKSYEDKIRKFKKTLEELSLKKSFSSIIEMDLYMFGLIYVTIFQDKDINTSRRDELMNRLQREYDSFKKDTKHRKSPSAKKYLLSRIKKSIKVYAGYVIR